MQVRWVVLCAVLAAGCSPKKYVVKSAADALSGTSDSTVWSGDDDPELVGDALPMVLKTMESLLDAQPDHVGLHLSLASGFMQYGYGFVQPAADQAEERSLAEAQQGWDRARKLYRRAHGYAENGLELLHPGFKAAWKANPEKALAPMTKADVPFLYWLGASQAALVVLSKDQPDVIAELPSVGLIMNRALALDEAYDGGALHEFMVSFESSRSEAMGGSMDRAKKHLDRAVELNGGNKAGPYLSWAEGYCVQKQDRACFDAMVNKALAVDVDKVKAFRLANTLSQRRARWLQARATDLIDSPETSEETAP